MSNIEIPDSVTSMGNSVFSGCTSLERAHLPNTRVNIMGSTFYNCKNLVEVNFPDTLETIRSNAFYGCEKLQSAPLPENLTTIEGSAFYNCKALTEITIPKAVTSIGSSAFENCDALETATLNGSGSIGSRAFYDCDALTDLTISDRVTSIGSNMCYGCDNLKNVKLSKWLNTIPDSAFRLCASLESISIPHFCTKIESNAFAEDTKLTAAYVPVSVTNIQTNSFSYPAKMTMYGKAGSYAEEYANSRNMAFNAVTNHISTIAYTDNSIKIARSSTVTPELQIMPDFDTDTITFTSDNENIATVSNTGAVYGKNYGTANITAATDSGISSTIAVTVVKPASGISLNKSNIEIKAGKNETLTATVTPDDSTDTVIWSSSDKSVAVVDKNGKVTGVSKGTATVTAKAQFGSKQAECSVIVVGTSEQIVNVTGITLDKTEKEIMIGKQYTLTASVLPKNATNKAVLWESSNNSVAAVADGVVTAKSLGEATITATTVNGGKTATCKITVVPKVEITKFEVNAMGAYALVTLTALNVPADASVFLASYGSNKLQDIQSIKLEGGSAQTILPISDVSKMKVIIMKKDSPEPLCTCGVWEK